MPTVDVDIKKLLESGAHFGHKTSRWHPKMAPYIYAKKGGIHIIDLTQTVNGLNKALDFVADCSSNGRQILLVGTKRQAKDVIKNLGEKTGMPYVIERWLGGTLTNWTTISGRVKHLKELEEKMASGELLNKYSKLEVQRFQEEIDRLNILYGGIKGLNSRPGALFVADILHDDLAVKEARRLGIPVVAIVDSNGDPTAVDFPIPANDDAIKTIQLIADYIDQAIEAGKQKTTKGAEKQGE